MTLAILLLTAIIASAMEVSIIDKGRVYEVAVELGEVGSSMVTLELKNRDAIFSVVAINTTESSSVPWDTKEYHIIKRTIHLDYELTKNDVSQMVGPNNTLIFHINKHAPVKGRTQVPLSKTNDSEHVYLHTHTQVI